MSDVTVSPENCNIIDKCACGPDTVGWTHPADGNAALPPFLG